MTTKIFGTVLVAAVVSIGALPLLAQKSAAKSAIADKYVISAEAGAVNYSEGDVTVSRFDGTGGPLIKGDRAKVGDRIHTSKGWAEILLNPGSYLRMGRDTTFQFRSTSLDDLRVRLEKGSAIFEVFTTSEFRVSIFTPKSRVTIAQSGVYRIDLSEDGTGTLAVVEGRAIVGDKAAYVVKEGRSATLDGAAPAAVLAKFDKKKMDEFAIWSKDRSKQLSQIAKSFDRKGIRNSLMSGFSMRRGGMGVWAYHPVFGYCFFSFFDGWDSPYGFSHRGIWPWYYPQYNTNNNNNGGGYYPPPTASSGDIKIPQAPPPPPVLPSRDSAPSKSGDIKVIN